MQIFRPRANTVFKVSAFGVLYVVALLVWSLAILDRSNYTRRVNEPIAQPIPYSHELHAGSLGMDCRYCHTAVENSAFANVPPLETCMACHNQVKANSLLVQPLKEASQTGKPFEWTRVHDLPDFVYFNHSIHVNKGVGCSTCHGRIDKMPTVWRVKDLTMGWCLDCHRAPENYLRPREEVFNMEWQPPAEQVALGRQLMQKYNVPSGRLVLTHCNICHR